jgi:2-iminoacetate synthase
MESIPSFCTACYRAGRVGEEFMKVEKSSFVHNYCVPNAIFTFKEYLLDYASEETRKIGDKVITDYIGRFKDDKIYDTITDYIKRLENGERDLRI